ncbi:MAG: methylenetetrahydrofolate reductase [Sphingomonadaceae bacterium]
MSYAAIHPNWDKPPANMMDGYSLEMTAKDRPALDEAASLIAPDTPIAVTFLPGEEMDERIAAAVHIRDLGFEPMPHLSARRIFSEDELATMMERLVREAGAKRVFLVAGDPPEPAGPFSDTLQMIRTGIFEANGITAVGIAGHPEGHPNVSPQDLWMWMEDKMADISARNMAPLVVTQFGFDPNAFLDWLAEMRQRGIEAPVRIGIPGPAGIKRLLRYAKFCGVGASSAVLRKYGISLTNLIGKAGPDKMVDALRTGLGPEHGRVRLHFYPFGGLKPTVEWINAYAARHGDALPRYDNT